MVDDHGKEITYKGPPFKHMMWAILRLTFKDSNDHMWYRRDMNDEWKPLQINTDYDQLNKYLNYIGLQNHNDST